MIKFNITGNLHFLFVILTYLLFQPRKAQNVAFGTRSQITRTKILLQVTHSNSNKGPIHRNYYRLHHGTVTSGFKSL